MAGLSSAFRLLQTARNTVATGLTFILSVAVGIWFTPFLIGRLGAESYGLVMLAAVVVSYAGPVVQSLSTRLARALAFAEAQDADRGKPAEAQLLLDEAMGEALRIALVMAAILAPFALLGPRLLGISASFRPEASAIFALTGGAFLVWVLSAPFAAILFYRNRLDLGNYAQMLQTLLRVGGAVLLMLWLGGQSWMIPAAGLAAALCSMIIGWRFSAAIVPLRFSYRQWRSTKIVRAARTGNGILAGTTLTMLLLGSELLVVNYMANEKVAGSYAAAMQIPVLIRSAMLSLATIAGPTILAHYSDGAIEEARLSAAAAMKRIGMLIALPTGITLAIAPLILSLWLGEDFAPYAPVVWLGLLGSIFIAASLPMYWLLVAADRNVGPAAYRAVGLVLYLALTLVLSRTNELGVINVAIGLCIGLVVPEVLLMAPRTARITHGSLATFLKSFGAALVAVGIAFALSWLLTRLWLPRNVPEICLFGAIVGLGHVVTCLILLDRPLISRAVSVTKGIAQRRKEQSAGQQSISK